MQLSGSAAQEELERFADVRLAALLLPDHSRILFSLQTMPWGTCTSGLHRP